MYDYLCVSYLICFQYPFNKMGDTNKMEKVPISSYNFYSDRQMLDKRSFSDWIQTNQLDFRQKTIKRAKIGDQLKNIDDETNYSGERSDRKDSHKSFYIKPTVNRRQIQKLSPYCSLNNFQVKSLEDFYSSINSLINRVRFFIFEIFAN